MVLKNMEEGCRRGHTRKTVNPHQNNMDCSRKTEIFGGASNSWARLR